jgi:predicted lipid-binding transport protein (Tim44 family)/tellurite resistance protein
MSTRLRSWILRVPAFVFFLVLFPLAALARVGGGEHYKSGNGNNEGGGDGGALVQLLMWLVFAHPCVGIPVVILVVGVYFYYQRGQGDSSTRKAIDKVEAANRTQVNASSVASWVSQLKAKDPAFELLPFFDRTKRLFVDLQDAWFKQNLEPLRRFVSDATFQRLVTQLRLMELQGVRDAIADFKVLDLQIIGLEQSEAFDTVHIRVRASMRDDDAPAGATEEQAHALAMKATPEAFTEVWSFVRKPGALTRAGDDSFQGKCPNCGAPFNGGAANRCEFCGAIVNSGNYDWVVAEITQGSEYADSSAPEGLARVRQSDPALSTELIEDRASLAFWKWVEAQVTGEPSKLAKLAAPEFKGELEADLEAVNARKQRRFFLECAVGAVNTRLLERDGDDDLASIEIRWSARIALAPEGGKPPKVPSQPQRSVLVLQRNSGATTLADNGMATNRCPQCGAPLTDNGQPSCEFCGATLSSGEQDWVIRSFAVWEQWQASHASSASRRPAGASARVPDREERERMVYVMAAMAMADGVVDQRERQLLKMASDRWGVPWANVELALNAGPELFNKLMARGSVEAEAFMQELVTMALVDGKIDAKERKLLTSAALHLGLQGRLDEFLKR